MARGLSRLISVAALVVLPATTWAANSLSVNAAAAMAGTNFGLEVVLQNPAVNPSTQAYVSIGPDKGLSNETGLSGTMYVNPGNMTMSSALGANHIQSFWLFQDANAPNGIKLIFFLQKQNAAPNTWFFTAWYRNANNNFFNFACNGFLAGSAVTRANGARRIDWEWEAGAGNGRLFIQRSNEDGSGTATICNVNNLQAGSQNIDRLVWGMVNPANHFAGTFGSFDLDEFSISRL
jgi:hypothetical protein